MFVPRFKPGVRFLCISVLVGYHTHSRPADASYSAWSQLMKNLKERLLSALAVQAPPSLNSTEKHKKKKKKRMPEQNRDYIKERHVFTGGQ